MYLPGKYKTITLPRQARDKHTESTQKRTRWSCRRAVWDYILQEFAGQKQLAIPNWTLAVGPSFGPNATLPTVRETPFWREFFPFKTIVLPRQAWDKQNKNAGEEAFFPQTFRTDAVRKATDWFFTERGPTACVPSPCMGFNQTTSPNGTMSIFYRGAQMCGTDPDLPEEVKANAMCVIEVRKTTGLAIFQPFCACRRFSVSWLLFT